LLDVTIKTGRTHQIRVHLAHAGHAIVGDDKYGDFPLNKALARAAAGARPCRFDRMFLHARRLHSTTRPPGSRIELTRPCHPNARHCWRIWPPHTLNPCDPAALT
jgi:23S rRNA pseudouridine955/2504/2580 synthase